MSSIDAAQRTCEKSGISIVVWSQYYSEVTTPLMCIQLHERMHIQNDIDVCSRYDIVAGIRRLIIMTFGTVFLGGFKQPTHCNSCMMCTTTILVLMRQERIYDTNAYYLVLPWSPYPPAPTIDKNNITFVYLNQEKNELTVLLTDKAFYIFVYFRYVLLFGHYDMISLSNPAWQI